MPTQDTPTMLEGTNEMVKDDVLAAIDCIRIATDNIVSERICNYIEANMDEFIEYSK